MKTCVRALLKRVPSTDRFAEVFGPQQRDLLPTFVWPANVYTYRQQTRVEVSYDEHTKNMRVKSTFEYPELAEEQQTQA